MSAKEKNRNNPAYFIIRRCLVFVILFSMLFAMTVDAVPEQPTEQPDQDTADTTAIISLMPYVDRKENNETHPDPITSREDTKIATNTTFLMMKLSMKSSDAVKYLGKAIYIFKQKSYEKPNELAGKEPLTSFNVQKDIYFELNIKILADFTNLSNGEIFNKYVLAEKNGENYIPICDSHYIDGVNCFSDTKDTPPDTVTKKGLQVQVYGDAKMLGVSQATVIMFINDFLADERSSNTQPYKYEGEDYFFNLEAINKYDKKIKSLTNDGIYVTAVLLVKNTGEISQEPAATADAGTAETAEGTITGGATAGGTPETAAPVIRNIVAAGAKSAQPAASVPMFYGVNASDADGVRYFEAFMSFFADRYVREDMGNGRVYNVILGDEIGRSTKSNYTGTMTLDEYSANYLRALRICDTAVRSRFGGARVYVPIDKSFAQRPYSDNDYINRELLDKLLAFSVKEGNFNWNVAIHPYNEDPSNPEFWLEASPTEDYSTPIITMKNIKVICEYLNLEKRTMQANGENRKVLISEVGFASNGNTPEIMAKQAAAFVYAYLKIRYLPDVVGMIYHNHVDTDSELNSFGIWTKEDNTPNTPKDKKPIYDVFRYMDTNNEAKTIEFAKDILGIQSFGEIVPLYNENEVPPVNLTENVAVSIKAKLNSTILSRFNSSDLSGYMSSVNIAAPTAEKLTDSGSDFNNAMMLTVKMNKSVKGDYSGIFKSFGKGEELDLGAQKYIGIKFRLETTETGIENVPVLLVLEGDFVPEEQGQTTTANVINSSALTNTPTSNNSINIYEGAATIKPNEDTVLYFDISQWNERKKITKIRFLINPHSSAVSLGSLLNSGNQNQTGVTGENAGSSSTTGISDTNYEFKLFIHDIFASKNKSFNILMFLLNIILIIILAAALLFAALVIRARIITARNRKRKRIMMEKRRQARLQTGTQPPRLGTSSMNQQYRNRPPQNPNQYNPNGQRQNPSQYNPNGQPQNPSQYNPNGQRQNPNQYNPNGQRQNPNQNNPNGQRQNPNQPRQNQYNQNQTQQGQQNQPRQGAQPPSQRPAQNQSRPINNEIIKTPNNRNLYNNQNDTPISPPNDGDGQLWIPPDNNKKK